MNYQWMMSQCSEQFRAAVKRRERLVVLFAVSYERERELLAATGLKPSMSRTQYINASIRALRLPDSPPVRSMSSTSPKSGIRLTGRNTAYQREYESAGRSGFRMRSTLLEYVNSRRKTDGLPALSASEMLSGNAGIQFRMQAGRTAEIMVFGDILADAETGAAQFVEKLRQFDGASEITVRINSDGGDPYQALAMYNALRSCPSHIRTVNEGMAASAASLLFMAGDVREMRPGSQLMIHEPEVGYMGRAEELLRMADAVSKSRDSFAQIYADRSGNTKEYILAIMKAETYFSADEAVQKGFATAVG